MSAIIHVSIDKGEQELCGPRKVVPNYDSLKATLYKTKSQVQIHFCDATILSTVSFLNDLREKVLEWGNLVTVIVVDSEMEPYLVKTILRQQARGIPGIATWVYGCSYLELFTEGR